ncbi:hypothetical protein SAMN05192552_11332 [Natrinema hispanicum]|uniref:Uncharacterized protein n=1 Tax=Natrinema hispanicum TaxID=392421 RepID=A0A1G6ZX01_9EURY|nr:hypothetical protein SAMN05192552_11332 [Natrinema hispanicum]SEU13514.1 hypothetical protein SAMN04488694_1598 [Natrinema hispanicum]
MTWYGLMPWRKPGSATATGREQPGPWRWWEVAVTAFTPAKKGLRLGYSHQRPRSGKWIIDHPVTASETRPSCQFRAAL